MALPCLSFLTTPHQQPRLKRARVTVRGNGLSEHEIQGAFDTVDTHKPQVQAAGLSEQGNTSLSSAPANPCLTEPACRKWHNTHCHDGAKFICMMEIDDLINWKEQTEGRLSVILASLPVAAHVAYLDFTGIMGLQYIDYLISDLRITHDEVAKYCDEKILRSPCGYLLGDDSVVHSPEKLKRSDFGLTNKCGVLFSLNHDYKFKPHLFKVSIDKLQRKLDSMLWLKISNESVHNNMNQRAHDQGVNTVRIIIASLLSRVKDLLARYPGQICSLTPAPKRTQPQQARHRGRDFQWSTCAVAALTDV